MPRLTYRTVLELASSLKAFLRLEAGLIRGAPPDPERELHTARQQASKRGRQLEQVQQRLAAREKELAEANHRTAALEAKSRAEEPEGVIEPRDVIWIFGTARVGSTWLADMLDELPENVLWREPLVGALFGNHHYGAAAHRADHDGILGGSEELRASLVRGFFLSAAAGKFPGARGRRLVVKEPNGSLGAPLLSEALPESRFVFLVRDPRDVVASDLEARSGGSWFGKSKEARDSGKASGNKGTTAVKAAEKYLSYLGNSARAYDEHAGPRCLVRYEELVADTPGTLERIHSELGLEADREALSRAVEKHAWSSIPEEKKGAGKFYRKGQPGSWREDLSEEQVRTVEEITAPLLERFYRDG